MDPTDLGGTPAVIPSNNWWENIGQQFVDTATSIALTRAAPSGTIASSNPNPPPGGGGINPQAASTPGGAPSAFRVGSLNLSSLTSSGLGGLVVLALLGYAALKLLRKV